MTTRSASRAIACRAGAALAVLIAALASAGSAIAQADIEYGLKAAYLYRFGFYVEWPAGTFPSPSSPINLCVTGEDPFGEALDKAVSGQRVNNRTLVVRRLKSVGRDSGCHIVYLGGSEAQRAAQAIEATRGSPVLTVSDAARGGAPGIVHFVIRDDRVRFEIDDEAAAQNGLAISSKLLGLALKVRPRKL